MSMNYGLVSPKFWMGSTGRQLRGDAVLQVVAIYLMTSPHANIIGVYHCPELYIAHETGTPLEGASKALGRLCEIGFCTFDVTTDTVWVHEMAKWQIGETLKPGDNRVKGIHRFFGQILNASIKRAFFEKYGDAFRLPEPPLAIADQAKDEGALKPLGSPFEGDRATITITDTINITDTITLTPSPSAPGSDGGDGSVKLPVRREQGSPSSQSRATNADFDEWWLNYPLKKSKAGAQKAYERIVRDAKATVAELLTGAMRYAAERSGQDPKYTKHPTTWLNNGCWADEGPPRLGGFTGPGGGNPTPRSGAVNRLLGKIQSDEREVS